MQVGGDGFAQRNNAVGGCVAVMAIAQRLDRGFDDVIGGAKIRLADAEIDDVAALGCQQIGTRQNRERVFLTDTVESGNRLQHGFLAPRMSPPSWNKGR